MWFEVSPCQSMCDALIDIVQSLLEHSWSHILLLLVLVQNFQQNLVGEILSLLTGELRPRQLLLSKHLNFPPAEQKLQIPSGKVQQTLRTLWLCCRGFHTCQGRLTKQQFIFITQEKWSQKLKGYNCPPLKEASQDVKGPLLTLPPRQLWSLVFLYLLRFLQRSTTTIEFYGH